MAQLEAGSRPRWVGMAAAVWVQVAAGNAHNFSLYSPYLKCVLGYRQDQLTLLGVANDIGQHFGMVAAVVCNRFPPWVLLLIGGAAGFLGYGLLWLVVSGTVTGLPYWALWIGLCIATNSGAWLGTGVLVTNKRNFPLKRRTVAGILKGYFGLSAAVYSEIYTRLLRHSSVNLLLFLTLGLPATSLLMMYFVRPCTPSSGEDSSEPCYFMFTQNASVFLGVYLLAAKKLVPVLPINDTITYILFGIMILLLLAPLAIPLKMTFYRRRVGLTSPSNPSDLPGSGETGLSDPLLNPSDLLGSGETGSSDPLLNPSDQLGSGETGSSDPLLATSDQLGSGETGQSDPATSDQLGSGETGSSDPLLATSDQLGSGETGMSDPATSDQLGSGETGISDPLLNPSDQLGSGEIGMSDPLLATSDQLGSGETGISDPLLATSDQLGSGETGISDPLLNDPSSTPYPGNFLAAIRKPDFWLLFLAHFIGVGSGVTVLNNLGQIASAVGVGDSPLSLCLFSFSNFAGRLVGGSVSEYFARSRMIPRPILMTVTHIVMAVVYILFALGLSGTFQVLIAFLGICYGVQSCVMVPTASELFGLEHFRLIYNFMLLGNPLGAYFFSHLLAAHLYEREAAKQGSHTCSGANCFRITFVVLSGVCTLGTFLSMILTMRLRPVYQMLYAGGSVRQPRSSEH